MSDWQAGIGVQVGEIADLLAGRGWRLATAESCTGGWIAKVLTDRAGSSAWFEGGVVSYSNAAKQQLLAVPARLLAEQGAVSEPVAAAMAVGVLAATGAEVALSVTGIAGPGGGSPDKPVGTVCFGWALTGQAPRTARERFAGDRDAVRRQAVVAALAGLARLLNRL